MEKRIIAVITETKSDVLEILQLNNVCVKTFQPGNINLTNLDDFDAIAILGGSCDKPILLDCKERMLVEKQLQKGKKIFSEFCSSIGHVHCLPQENTRYQRLAFLSEDISIEGVKYGDLLDDQCGTRIKPYPEFKSAYVPKPILQFVTVHSHSKLSEADVIKDEITDRALWFDIDNLLVCSFKLSNFIKARYAPKVKFRKVVKFILEWLTQQEINVDCIPEAYHNGVTDKGLPFEHLLGNCIDNAFQWFDKSKILINDGIDGVQEGLATEIYPDGQQKVNTLVRLDCTGEVSMAYLMHYLLKNDVRSLEISNNLSSMCFDFMQYKEDDHLRGMMRWTEEGWGICYQDDVARAIIPQLLKCLYLNNSDYLQECMDALNFLLRTTGTDGTRVYRTENMSLDKAEMERLSNTSGNYPSAHYNAYYLAALMLAYKITGIEQYKATAVLGMEAIMSVYPDTIREQSQTEEYCRLILPLSWLYWCTNKNEHKDWLYKVTKDMQQFKHTSGAYCEWDEGYKASMRNDVGEGECSLLSNNGDPIVDLLYSNNWLPMGFIQAYFVTGDVYFKNLWEQNVMFMINAQIISKNNQINGSWARGFDVELKEVYGSSADIGWGPWAIESGWTVAEIVTGLMMGELEDKICKYHK